MIRTIILLFFLSAAGKVQAQDYLDNGEFVIIGASSAAIAVAGIKIKRLSQKHSPLIRGHLPFELSFQRWLGGVETIGQKNFLDSKFGSIVTPLASGVFLSGTNMIFPRNRPGKDFGQDLFLFVSGVIATSGITDMTKGIVARERPFYALSGDRIAIESRYDGSFLRHSFFSGHAASAFFSVTFLNIRLRDTMRRRMTRPEFNSWKTVSSTVLFGWASFVGLSRVQADRHHLSDVITGAVVGTLMAELFYGFGESEYRAGPGGSHAQLQFIIQF